MRLRTTWRGAVVFWALGTTACSNGDGNTPNVLPDPSGSSSTSVAGTTVAPAESSEAGTSAATTSVDDVVPRTYRFDCIDIQVLGDVDGTAFQANLLEDTWGSDIDNFKLNIMMEVAERDAAGQTAVLGIRSGVGPDASDLCAEANTESELISVEFLQDSTRWEGSSEDGTCSVMATGTVGNTYDMALPPERVVYIYAEDDDTTTFNCTPEAAVPDAVPIRAVRAEVSTDASESTVWGRLDGCLLESEAQTLCSCLGECQGDGPDDLQTEGPCAGCPTGGNPLDVLLLGVNPSKGCTEVMGAPAFDLSIGFSGRVLPAVPSSCE